MILNDEGFKSFVIWVNDMKERSPHGNVYSPFTGSISMSLEETTVIPSLYHESLYDAETTFQRLTDYRYFVCDLVSELKSRGDGRLLPSSLVDWNSVANVIARVPMHVLRSSESVVHVSSMMYRTHDPDELEHYLSIHGDNMLMFICSISGVDEESEIPLLSLVTSLHCRDVSYVTRENESPTANRLADRLLSLHQ